MQISENSEVHRLVLFKGQGRFIFDGGDFRGSLKQEITTMELK